MTLFVSEETADAMTVFPFWTTSNVITKTDDTVITLLTSHDIVKFHLLCYIKRRLSSVSSCDIDFHQLFTASPASSTTSLETNGIGSLSSKGFMWHLHCRQSPPHLFGGCHSRRALLDKRKVILLHIPAAASWQGVKRAFHFQELPWGNFPYTTHHHNS